MRLALIFIFLFLSSLTYAQRFELPDSTSVFGQRVSEMMHQTGNAYAIEVGDAFQSTWESGFNAAQKDKIVKFSRKMLREDAPVYPVFTNYFSMLSSAVSEFSISSSKLDDLLSIVEQSYVAYNNRTFAQGLATLNNLFTHRALFYSKNNKLYLDGGEIEFVFNEMSQNNNTLDFADQLVNDLSDEDEGDSGWDTEPTDDSGWEDSNSDDGWGDDGWGDSGATDDGWGDSSGSSNDGWSNDGLEDPLAETPEEDLQEVKAKDAVMAVASVNIPPAQGATIKITNANLVFVTRYDSVTLKGTSGDYEYHKYRFIGEGGTFGWALAGYDEKNVYTELDKYSFDTRLPEFKAEKTKQHFKPLISDKIEGAFHYKSVKRDTLGNAAYPQFISYYSDIEYNFDYDGFYFKGGFSLKGRQQTSNSIANTDNLIYVESNKGRQFKGLGTKFFFEDTVVIGRKVDITVYHNRDSITHPSVKLLYYPTQKRLVATKEKDGFNLSPYSASYYNMTIEADMIDWDLNSDSMNISILNAKSLIPATFESREYFSREKLEEMSGVYKFNPVVLVFSYGSKIGSREFYADDMAKDMKLNENAVHSAMLFMWNRGFIDYDPDYRKVLIKDKLIHYVRSRRKTKDYDELLITSLSKNAPNATLHLDSDEMTIRGIDRFYISETQDIYILPFDNTIRLLKDRDFTFEGQLFAGNFEFGGRNFTFKYDSFLIDLGNIDSIKFKVEGEDFRKKEVDNKLVSVDLFKGSSDLNASTSGTLYINKPDNKSGNRIYPEYPIFDAERGAVVYFDQADILDGAYDKSIYFYIPPFGIDSLSAEDPAAIGFEGVFITEGILPDFKETLRIMPDNSLGFTHSIPPEGYDLYNGTGKIYNKLKLNKKGLVANGKIEYLSSTSVSDAYTFYMDSVVAEGTEYTIDPGDINGASFPEIKTTAFRMNWQPKADKMYVYNQDQPFDLYGNTATLNGGTILSANGVNGMGVFNARGFEAKSEEFTFKETEMTARHSDFVLASENPEKPLMQGEDIRLDFDLRANIGQLSPEVEGVAALEFPYAQVKTSISQATWDLDAEKVRMEKPDDVDISSSYFYTTRKELDSLAFNATAAEYDLNTSELLVSGIPFIEVADAMITPENNEVLILENATIGTLYNTDIIIDTLYQYHHLFDGTIDIISSKKFDGDATYRLVNAVKDTFAIKFEEFELREVPEAQNRDFRGLQTVSGGTIAADNNLVISPGMLYKGDVTMYAQQKPLKLEGYVKLNFQNHPEYDTWIKYQSQDEETQEVVFDIRTSVTEDGKSLNAGLHYGATDFSLYGTFVEERKNIGDEDFFLPKGQLWFDESINKYVIMDSLKADGRSYEGDVFMYNETTSDVDFEGMLSFLEENESIQMRVSGRGTGNIEKEEFKVNTLTIFDFDLPDAAFVEMFNHVFETVEVIGAAEAEPDQDALIYKMAAIVGDKAAVDYDQRSLQEYIPVMTASNKLIGDIVFSNLNFKWNKDLKTWYSDGRLGLSHILKNDVNALVDGFVEVRKTDKGDVVNVFIQVSPDCFYFFNFEDNKLTTYSNNEDFNVIIAGKTKIDKAGFGEYVFIPGDRSDALNFINRFRLDHLGIEQPYEMYVPEPAPQQESLEFLQEQTTPEEGETISEEELQKQEEEQKKVDDNLGF